jgi:hypothetical membrane protein
MTTLHTPVNDKGTRMALGAGISVPLLYFGLQVAAAPFYPDYNLLTTSASDLGATTFIYGGIVSIGIIVVGIAALVAATGVLVALLRLRAHPILAGLTAAAIACVGLSSLWAGFVPLPDSAHGGPPFLLVGMLLVAPLLLTVTWHRYELRLLHIWLVISIVLVLALMPLMSGALGDIGVYRGLTQKVLALAVFGSVGIGAYALRRALTLFRS